MLMEYSKREICCRFTFCFKLHTSLSMFLWKKPILLSGNYSLLIWYLMMTPVSFFSLIDRTFYPLFIQNTLQYFILWSFLCLEIPLSSLISMCTYSGPGLNNTTIHSQIYFLTLSPPNLQEGSVIFLYARTFLHSIPLWLYEIFLCIPQEAVSYF